MMGGQPSMLQVREALERSWCAETAYRGAVRPGIPALAQCYPTARVVQILFPAFEIVEGTIWTGRHTEKHFWNLLTVDGVQYHVDLTWQQFPSGSSVRAWEVRERSSLGDSAATLERVNVLLRRVTACLAIMGSAE